MVKRSSSRTDNPQGKRGGSSGTGDSKALRLTCSILQEGDRYVARCLEVMASASGRSVRQALQNLRTALELYFAQGGAVPVPSPAFIEFVEVELPS